MQLYAPKGRQSLVGTFKRYRWKIAKDEIYIKYGRLGASARLRGYRRRARYLHRSYGETPVLMHTESVIALLDYLTWRHGDWLQCLVSNDGWTEYTLYFQFVEHRGDLERLYATAHPNAVLDVDSSVWHGRRCYRRAPDFSPRKLAKANKGAGPFIAVQSYVPLEDWIAPRHASLDAFYDELERELSA